MASQPIIKMKIVVKSFFTPKPFSYTACFFFQNGTDGFPSNMIPQAICSNSIILTKT